jgi:hypothetical protein
LSFSPPLIVPLMYSSKPHLYLPGLLVSALALWLLARRSVIAWVLFLAYNAFELCAIIAVASGAWRSSKTEERRGRTWPSGRRAEVQSLRGRRRPSLNVRSGL